MRWFRKCKWFWASTNILITSFHKCCLRQGHTSKDSRFLPASLSPRRQTPLWRQVEINKLCLANILRWAKEMRTGQTGSRHEPVRAESAIQTTIWTTDLDHRSGPPIWTTDLDRSSSIQFVQRERPGRPDHDKPSRGPALSFVYIVQSMKPTKWKLRSLLAFEYFDVGWRTVQAGGLPRQYSRF